MNPNKVWKKIFGYREGDRIVFRRDYEGYRWSKEDGNFVRMKFPKGTKGVIKGFPELKQGGYSIEVVVFNIRYMPFLVDGFLFIEDMDVDLL